MKFWKGILLSSAIVFSGLVIWWILTPVPEMVRAGNVAARSFSVGWVTEKPARGCAIAFLSVKHFRRACIEGVKRTTHLVAIDGLRPETNYRLFLIDGLRVTIKNLPAIATKKISDSRPVLPRPGYGQVADDKFQPVPGALVYIYVNSKRQVEPLLALTNSEGNYAVDLANFPAEEQSYTIEVTAAAKWRAKMEADIRTSSPFPTVYLDLEGVWSKE